MKSRLILHIPLLVASIACCSCERVQRTVETAQEAYNARRAAGAAKNLAGYESFKSSFCLKNDPYIGNVNSMPESLFLDIRATKGQQIDGAWWWNPLSNGTPSSSWHDFLVAFNDAERIVGKHAWLTNLKALGENRSLELHLLGTGVGVDNIELERFILPAWKHAGMAGQPKYCILARRGKSWVELIFSEVDDRAFVYSTSTLTSDGPPQSPIDSITLKAGERSSKCAIISPDGKIVVRTLVTGED